ncbi:MAG: hemin receptor [Planctomycetes bacterium]|nr:hemin receptor [Planctomycetota bacterium]
MRAEKEKERFMAEQKKKLIQTLAFVINGLDDLPATVQAVQDLGRRHRDYGTVSDQYPIVGEALLWTIEQGLGASWNDELAIAWTAAYTLVAEVMNTAMNAGDD